MKLTKAQLVRIKEVANENYRATMPNQRDGQEVHLATCWLDALISTLATDGIIITSRDKLTGVETTLEV